MRNSVPSLTVQASPLQPSPYSTVEEGMSRSQLTFLCSTMEQMTLSISDVHQIRPSENVKQAAQVLLSCPLMHTSCSKATVTHLHALQVSQRTTLVHPQLPYTLLSFRMQNPGTRSPGLMLRIAWLECDSKTLPMIDNSRIPMSLLRRLLWRLRAALKHLLRSCSSIPYLVFSGSMTHADRTLTKKVKERGQQSANGQKNKIVRNQ